LFYKKLNEKQEANVIKLYQKGISLTNIAEIFNVSRNLVNTIIEAHHIAKKEPGFYAKKIATEQEAENIKTL